MFIKSIKWIDEIAREAEVEVSDSKYSIVCFSQPCMYSINQNIVEPLECVNTKNIVLSYENEFLVKKEEGKYGYTISGKLIDDSGIVQIGNIMLHIGKINIPKDIESNRYIVFYTDRIDLW